MVEKHSSEQLNQNKGKPSEVGFADAPEIEIRAEGELAESADPKTWRIQWTGVFLGLGAALVIYLVTNGVMPEAARITAATAVLMAIWWMTEAIPIPATALLPLVIFPVFTPNPDKSVGANVSAVGASYGHSIIFLFMGGFMLALGMQRWNLHRRIALLTVKAMGTRPSRVIAGFMIATAFLSMWVSNTATAVMMLPIGVSVLMLVSNLGDSKGKSAQNVKDAVLKSNFGTALMLGIAYAASLGSLSTIIGTPPNAFLVGYLDKNFDIKVNFGQWMIVGTPIAIIMLFATWVLLTKVLFKPEIKEIPGGRELLNQEYAKLGPMTSAEWRVLIIFLAAVVSWIAVPLIFKPAPIADASIAILAALLMFLVPSGTKAGVRILDWDSAAKLPWGILLLFGGGLALSVQFGSSGLTNWVGEKAASLEGLPVILVVAVLVTGVTFLTELTSNTATTATAVPIVGGLAMGLNIDVLVLTIPVALAATCAFMLPVATPPNAIAFSSGYVTVGQMVKGGFWLNWIAIIVITLVATLLIPLAFGLST